MRVKFITAIYSNLYGTKFGGRISRRDHYRWSLISLLKMTNADFTCFCPQEELEELETFFFTINNIDRNQLEFKVFDLENHYFKDLFDKYKNYESSKVSDRCIELQYMKFIWTYNETKDYDYYYWIDAGLSHCGLIPNKYLSFTGPHNRGYYESNLFNNNFLEKLVNITDDKFVVISKENRRNYWSGTVNQKHFTNFDNSRHIIGGLFGGNKILFNEIVNLFEKYVYRVTEEDNFLYHEEDIMTLLFRNHNELFTPLEFDIWWHEDERIAGADIEKLCRENKSFYKILEELNG